MSAAEINADLPGRGRRLVQQLLKLPDAALGLLHANVVTVPFRDQDPVQPPAGAGQRAEHLGNVALLVEARDPSPMALSRSNSGSSGCDMDSSSRLTRRRSRKPGGGQEMKAAGHNHPLAPAEQSPGGHSGIAAAVADHQGDGIGRRKYGELQGHVVALKKSPDGEPATGQRRRFSGGQSSHQWLAGWLCHQPTGISLSRLSDNAASTAVQVAGVKVRRAVSISVFWAGICAVISRKGPGRDRGADAR